MLVSTTPPGGRSPREKSLGNEAGSRMPVGKQQAFFDRREVLHSLELALAVATGSVLTNVAAGNIIGVVSKLQRYAPVWFPAEPVQQVASTSSDIHAEYDADWHEAAATEPGSVPAGQHQVQSHITDF